MYAKHNWTRLSLFWKVNIAPIALCGALLDVAFNWTFGFMFLDVPPLIKHEIRGRTITVPEGWFSSRVQRIYSTGDGWRLRLATFWKRNLNLIDPGHIRDTNRYD
jgi:hypothetical protein